MDRENISGAVGNRLDLLPQRRDVHVNGTGRGHCVVTPDFVQELIPRENRAAILNQVAKQSYLARLQFNWLSIPLDHRQPAINGDGVELIDLRSTRPDRKMEERKINPIFFALFSSPTFSCLVDVASLGLIEGVHNDAQEISGGFIFDDMLPGSERFGRPDH